MSENFTIYSTNQVADLFNVSLETIRIWCNEFEGHLSPRANPGHRQRRAFNGDDLGVLALVATLKAEGLTYTDIHVSLKNGERGELPIHPISDDTALITQQQQTALATRINSLQSELNTIIEENERLREELDDEKRRSLRNEVKAEMLTEQLAKTEQQVKDLLDERSKLERSLGSMESDLRWQKQDKDETEGE